MKKYQYDYNYDYKPHYTIAYVHYCMENKLKPSKVRRFFFRLMYKFA